MNFQTRSKHFSKNLNKLIDKDLKKNLDYGNHIHYLFEVYDFKNDNIIFQQSGGVLAKKLI